MNPKHKNYFFLFLFVMFFTFSLAEEIPERIVKDSYTISKGEINRELTSEEYFRDFIEIENSQNSQIKLDFKFSENLNEIVSLENQTLIIPSGEQEKIYFIIQGKSENFTGTLTITGSFNEIIPVNIYSVQEKPSNPFLMKVSPIKDSLILTEKAMFKTDIKILKSENLENITFNYTLYFNNQTYPLENINKSFNNSISFVTEFDFPEEVTVGEGILFVTAEYNGTILSDRAYFLIQRSFLDKRFLGFIPMWLILTLVTLGVTGFLTYYLIKKHLDSKKKYKMSVDLKTLPPKDKENLFLGKIAETNHFFYFDPNKLTTHCIVAGATGGGKSITAQVIIEECLKKNIAIIVFDPTAQWSGMLRKSTDKKMMAYYPQFGLKKQDAQAFKGNVRMVKNARQVIDINKYIAPGQIQIFSLNKLDPKEMDVFVASIIRQIFKNDPKEYPGLKTLLVFDEVHRLLPKFGGSGAGFVQIERACREFRKWGLGIFLVSQVLNDFVGEIKANISTEVQMRTRDEGDLKRIETKNGEEFLQSLVKASSGVGMLSNPAYNHARPFFVQFRPILHNTKRLEDEELEKYNAYNDQVDDIEFQIEELEKEKVDVFDFKMELKLVKDKIMSGSFSVVEIYLEGLKPRIQKEWEKLGKKPPERKIELVSEEEIAESIKKAQEEREKAKKVEGADSKKEEEVKQKLEDKIVASLTFDNGAMISSLKELREYLPNMSENDFKIHVNENKNDILTWVNEKFGKELAKGLEGKGTKAEIQKTIEDICAEKEQKPVEDSKKVTPPEDQPSEKQENSPEEKKEQVEPTKTETPSESQDKQLPSEENNQTKTDESPKEQTNNLPNLDTENKGEIPKQ